MELAINIALVTLVAIGALTAIGGETSRQNESHFWRKITLRGWFFVSCVFFTLILGVIKEIRSNAASERAEHAQTKLRNELQTANQKLESASQKLQEMKSLIAKLEKELNKMNIEMDSIPKRSTFKLKIKCASVPDMDPRPYPDNTDAWVDVLRGSMSIGRTQVIVGNDSPCFNESFRIPDYATETITLIVYDHDRNDNEVIGKALISKPETGTYDIFDARNNKVGYIQIEILSN